MKSQHPFYFFLAFTLLPILIGCESKIQTQTQPQAQTQAVTVAHQTGKMQHDNDAATRKAMATKAWQALKEIADKQIEENAIQIVSLGLPIRKKLSLEHRNRDLQFRIDTYPQSNTEWELFSRAYKNDMKELRTELQELQAASR